MDQRESREARRSWCNMFNGSFEVAFPDAAEKMKRVITQLKEEYNWTAHPHQAFQKASVSPYPTSRWLVADLGLTPPSAKLRPGPAPRWNPAGLTPPPGYDCSLTPPPQSKASSPVTSDRGSMGWGGSSHDLKVVSFLSLYSPGLHPSLR
ncbi:hypothetical protein AAY473_019682 [Plecturocebus cupreus]